MTVVIDTVEQLLAWAAEEFQVTSDHVLLLPTIDPVRASFQKAGGQLADEDLFKEDKRQPKREGRVVAVGDGKWVHTSEGWQKEPVEAVLGRLYVFTGYGIQEFEHEGLDFVLVRDQEIKVWMRGRDVREGHAMEQS